MEHDLLISIVVPVYNSEEYIDRCLKSILSQTYSNIEVIVIDDGSVDDSYNKCKWYQLNDERIKVYHKKNEGASETRNYGLALCTGEYVMFVDSDDWLDCNCVEACVGEVHSNLSIDCVLFPYVREYKNISKIRYTLGKEKCLFKNDLQTHIHRRFFGLYKSECKYADNIDDLSALWGKLYKYDKIKNVKLVSLKDLGTGEDCLFNAEVFHDLLTVSYIPNCFYHYNKENSTSIVHIYDEKFPQKRKKLYRYLLDIINKYNLDDSFREALDNRVVLGLMPIILQIVNSNLEYKDKYLSIKKLLSDDVYKLKFKTFSVKYLDIKWKLYFLLCKYKLCNGVLLLTVIANILKKYLR